ncbi:MAG: MBL fold metallo-hydrolase [Pseudomonadota bacterium]
MTVLKWLGLLFLVLTGAGMLALIWLTTARPDLSEFDNLYASPAQSPVTVRFFGTSSMMFSDGETKIIIDGWFTRPSTRDIFLGKIEPDIKAIDDGLARLGSPEIAALVAVHSHLDHAMDVAEVAKRTGALLVGSDSTANIGRGGGLPENQIKVVEDGETLRFGDFSVSLIETRHFESPNDFFTEADPFINEPLTPPVSAFAYRQGKAYSVLIEHPDGSALIQSSAGFEAGALKELDVDVVYLGVGFLTSQTPDYQDAYWREVVTATDPEGIYIIHWDSFSRPLAETAEYPAAPIRLWNDIFGMRTKTSVNFAVGRAQMHGISAALLPMWEEVDAFQVALDPSYASSQY